jgi:hypothetical protein
MKTLLFSLAALLSAFTSTAHARIDETLAECETRYGPIVQRVKAKLTGSDPDACVFTKAGITIIAEFKAGKAWSIAYRLVMRDENAVQALLTAEGTDAGWTAPITLPGQTVRQSLDRKRVAIMFTSKRVEDPTTFVFTSREFVQTNRSEYETMLTEATRAIKARKVAKPINDL